MVDCLPQLALMMAVKGRPRIHFKAEHSYQSHELRSRPANKTTTTRHYYHVMSPRRLMLWM